MTEIEIETTCFECETDFDDSNDTRRCSVCDNDLCDGCEEKHAVDHCFETQDAIKKPNNIGITKKRKGKRNE